MSNKMINSTSVMGGFIPEVVSMICDDGQTAVLMLDQSEISDGFECLMVSLRVGKRALPVAWKVAVIPCLSSLEGLLHVTKNLEKLFLLLCKY